MRDEHRNKVISHGICAITHAKTATSSTSAGWPAPDWSELFSGCPPLLLRNLAAGTWAVRQSNLELNYESRSTVDRVFYVESTASLISLEMFFLENPRRTGGLQLLE